jgi:hypothetical protein
VIEPDAKYAQVFHWVFAHEPECPALRDDDAA